MYSGTTPRIFNSKIAVEINAIKNFVYKTCIFENETFDHPDRVYQVQPESINDFKNQLNRGVSCFWGNDSGPSHLAANMGIPTNVCYRVTNSVIWKPTGPKVYVHEFSEDSN